MAWNTASPYSTAHTLVANTTAMQWADTFAFDNRGALLFTTNRLQLFIAHTMGFTTDSNFRIFKVQHMHILLVGTAHTVYISFWWRISFS